MQKIEISFWNRRQGKNKVKKNFSDYESFRKFMERQNPDKGRVSAKINGGYGENHETGHTFTIDFQGELKEFLDLFYQIIETYK
jgi:hypothetical protein